MELYTSSVGTTVGIVVSCCVGPAAVGADDKVLSVGDGLGAVVGCRDGR